MKESDSELLTRYFDGECSPAERSRAEQILSDDPSAVEALDNFSQQKDNWQNLPPALNEVEVETDWNRLKTRILTEEPPEEIRLTYNRMAWARYWTWGAAAAVFALASVIFLLPQEDRPSAAVYNTVETVETDIDGATPIIFVDKQSGWSVVWVDEAAAS